MFILLRVLVLGLFVSGLSTPAAAKTHSVIFINPGGEQGFWGSVTAVMQEASKQLDIDLEVLHSNRNRLLMLEHANEIVGRDITPDVVIVVNELQQGSDLLGILGGAGVPVYFLLNTLSDNQINSVGSKLNKLPEVIGSIVPELSLIHI